MEASIILGTITAGLIILLAWVSGYRAAQSRYRSIGNIKMVSDLIRYENSRK
jgi:hypothetical protein